MLLTRKTGKAGITGMLSLSQNAHISGSIFQTRLPKATLSRIETVRSCYPAHTIYYIICTASCTTCLLCLCKSFKELFSCMPTPSVWAKADAKVRLFSEIPKLFKTFFTIKRKVFAFVDNAKTLHLIILYRKGIKPISRYSKISSISSPSSKSSKPDSSTLHGL